VLGVAACFDGVVTLAVVAVVVIGLADDTAVLIVGNAGFTGADLTSPGTGGFVPVTGAAAFGAGNVDLATACVMAIGVAGFVVADVATVGDVGAGDVDSNVVVDVDTADFALAAADG
jgi:hypothetical protein